MNVTYMSGAGNDFMVVDARGKEYDFEAMAIELCKITGADGFMAVDYSDKADFKLHFYNSDGTRGEMCGNGARCICRYAYDNKIAGAEMVVETDAGLVPGWRLDTEMYRVKLNNPGVLDLNRLPDAAYIELGNPGVPHAVREVPGLSYEKKDEYHAMAKALRHDPAFPKGANANLYTWISEDAIRILTFERGVEDYTLACGTGTGSTAVKLWMEGRIPSGRLVVQNMGGLLVVTIEGDENGVTSILLDGGAEVLKKYKL